MRGICHHPCARARASAGAYEGFTPPNSCPPVHYYYLPTNKMNEYRYLEGLPKRFLLDRRLDRATEVLSTGR